MHLTGAPGYTGRHFVSFCLPEVLAVRGSALVIGILGMLLTRSPPVMNCPWPMTGMVAPS